jgi:8-amino-7-oxononanoate synthase
LSARLDAALRAEMARWESRGLRRDLDAQVATSVARENELCSNDYLSLAQDPRIADAARAAIAKHGTGGRAARLLGGGCELDGQAERDVAEWLQAESALLFPTGYQANVGLIATLAGPGAAIFSDELNHASIIDGARMSRAHVHVYRHLDVEHLDRLLAAERGATQRFVVTETVFSMDGDVAPLLALHELCAKHDAYLLLDEAHAVGLIGFEGAGGWIAADPRNEIGASPNSRLAARLVTGGKALGVSGAFVVGSRVLRDHLANRARSFVFTTAVPPAVSGALRASIELARDASAARTRTRSLAARMARELSLPEPAAAIVPFVCGAAADALDLSRKLLEDGLDVRAVRPPTVPDGSARLRIVCHAHNSDESIDKLVKRLRRAPSRTTLRIEPRTKARVMCVVGTDTDVGKTVVSALLVRAALRHGPVSYWKPVQTGSDDDTATVARLAGASASVLEPLHRFALPASPHTAAAAAGSRIDVDALSDAWRRNRAESVGTFVIELAGGLLVPYDESHTQADLLARERTDVVLVARSGLGTLNHTLLTLEALFARSLDVRALFLVGERHAANAATLRERTRLPLYELERLEPLDAEALDAWIARNELTEILG